MMKNTTLLLFCVLISFGINAQSLLGAWEATTTSEDGNKLKHVIIFTDGYQSEATYNAITGEFMSTTGGAWHLSDGTLTKTVEFDTEHPEHVGTEISFDISIAEASFTNTQDNITYNNIDTGQPGALHGAWLMAGRVTDGEIQLRDNIDVPRKTMKILSGTRFQWIAYNTETKEFLGTGGGTYTTIGNDYTETIEFFSRDNSRVGLGLKFNFELIDGYWHHSGFSSKGDPIHEVWSLRR